MFRRWTCLLVLTTLTAVAAAEEKLTPARFYQLWTEADARYSAGDYTEAAAIYEKLSAARPGDGYLVYRLGNSHYRAGNLEKALEPGLAALEMGYGSEAPTAYSIAGAMAAAGRPDDALRWLERAMEARFEDPSDLRTDDALAPLRSHPRFRELAGIPEGELDREAGWRFDLDYFLAEARRLHAAPGSPAHTPEFARRVEELQGRVGELSNERVALELQRILASLGDGHSSLYPIPTAKVPFRYLPVKLYFFADGLFVIAAAPEHSDLVGKKVVAIGGRDTATALDDLAPFISRDNDQGLVRTGPRVLALTAALEALGYADGTDAAVLTVEDADGTRRDVEVGADSGQFAHAHFRSLAPPPGTAPEDVPLWLRAPRDLYWHTRLDGLDALYVQVNGIGDEDGEPVAEYARRLRAELDASGAGNLILDLRHNSGGNNFKIWPLVRLAAYHEMAAPEHRIFVITSRETFSAAQNLVNFLERSTSAVFVGEESSSRPNFTGETTSVVLPYSGLRMSISSRYWQDSFPADRRPAVPIALPAPMSSTDYFSNRDPVLDALREALDDRPVLIMETEHSQG